jgi:nucleoside 2-deoxyribosyltransferase
MNQYRDKDPLEKMDQALINLEMATKYVGQEIKVSLAEDFLYYHCFSSAELSKILLFVLKQEYIDVPDIYNPQNALWISPKGYLRLRELRKSKDSRQCFVAMWLSPEMNKVYEDSIQPAIEYIEEGEAEPRFRALKIDNKEHTNDINDEIISEIRRSRFMVCDLTGYRGGVYFEAGFAYGLGLEVIYTCKEDWLKKQVEKIKDTEGKTHEIVQEGIHFDLEHRSRIPWTEDNLSEFEKKLTNRIKAVIV